MADPVTALAAVSFAGNVLQFVGLGLRAAKIAWRTKEDSSAMGREFGGLDELASQLEGSTRQLSRQISSYNDNTDHRTWSSEDMELKEMAERCRELAQKLISAVQRYEIRQGKPLRNFYTALQAVLGKKGIEEMEKELEHFQPQLNTRVLVHLK